MLLEHLKRLHDIECVSPKIVHVEMRHLDQEIINSFNSISYDLYEY